MDCKHPMESRKFEGGDLVCGICGTVLTKKKAEDVDLFAVPLPSSTVEPGECEKRQACIHGDDDCHQEGAVGREFDCFEPAEDISVSLGTAEQPVIIDSENVEDAATLAAGLAGASAGSETNRTFIRQLRVHIPEDELAEKGEEMARLIGVWTKAKLDKKAYDKAAKKLIDETEERYIEIAEIVEAGSEERDVQCYAEFDTAHGIKRIFRCDTYELVAEETLTAAELQMDFNYVAEQSVANVEAAFNQETPEIITEGAVDEEQEEYQGEAGESETGEVEEAKGDVAVEEGNPFTDENSKPEGFVPRPDDCEEQCVYGEYCPPTCGKIMEKTEDKL